ncbi:probable myosin-binding protein 5 [Telopea speciosissima]|uniref:probable myosin-binding protein 5 n=1 Tax=Telopea speciosissima TaxID=54955 RepID=UPI001CC7D9CA|nr:probable myosin-binding protein 5 [Telopea speciosissima]
MHILGCCCFYYCYVQRLLSIFSRFLMMENVSCLNPSSRNTDFGFELSVFGFFKALCNWLAILIMFGLAVKVLRLGFYGRGFLVRLLSEIMGKSNVLINGFCSTSVVDVRRFLEDSNSSSVSKNRTLLSNSKDVIVRESCSESESEEGGSEEDAPAFKRLVRIERDRANAVYLELEKERTAAASAAEEAMAMIQRLQTEKSLVEMQANQYRRLAEQKQLYDLEVIQSLRWILLKHESDRSLLENQLNLCRQRLKQYRNADKGDQTDGIDQSLFTHSSFSAVEDGIGDILVSSLEMDSSLM